MKHFADGTHLSYASKKLSTIEFVINYELKKIAEWLRSNKLSLNSGKLQKKAKKELHKIIIKSKLSPVANANYCGVFLDEFLYCDARVNNCVKK